MEALFLGRNCQKVYRGRYYDFYLKIDYNITDESSGFFGNMLRPTILEVNLKNIAYNINQFKKIIKKSIFMGVVKANAYGHGVIEISKIAIENGVKWLCVATIEEGIEIREAGIRVPILILGGILPEQVSVCAKYNLDITISSMNFFRRLKKHLNNNLINVHLNIDTGMHRIGITLSEIIKFISLFKKMKSIKLVGIWTHFPTADSIEQDFSLKQIRLFSNLASRIKETYGKVILIHAANSSAVINLPQSHFDMVRIGLGMYGYYDAEFLKTKINLKPAVTWKSKIISIREIDKGIGIGYGKTYITKRKTKIATLPVGYADGFNRLLSNVGQVIVNRERANIIGRICMDQSTIDVTDVPNVKEGDDVVLIGKQGSSNINIYEICQWIHSIPNEVLVNISKRVHRVYK